MQQELRASIVVKITDSVRVSALILFNIRIIVRVWLVTFTAAVVIFDCMYGTWQYLVLH